MNPNSSIQNNQKLSLKELGAKLIEAYEALGDDKKFRAESLVKEARQSNAAIKSFSTFEKLLKYVRESTVPDNPNRKKDAIQFIAVLSGSPDKQSGSAKLRGTPDSDTVASQPEEAPTTELQQHWFYYWRDHRRVDNKSVSKLALTAPKGWPEGGIVTLVLSYSTHQKLTGPIRRVGDYILVDLTNERYLLTLVFYAGTIRTEMWASFIKNHGSQGGIVSAGLALITLHTTSKTGKSDHKRLKYSDALYYKLAEQRIHAPDAAIQGDFLDSMVSLYMAQYAGTYEGYLINNQSEFAKIFVVIHSNSRVEIYTRVNKGNPYIGYCRYMTTHNRNQLSYLSIDLNFDRHNSAYSFKFLLVPDTHREASEIVLTGIRIDIRSNDHPVAGRVIIRRRRDSLTLPKIIKEIKQEVPPINELLTRKDRESRYTDSIRLFAGDSYLLDFKQDPRYTELRNPGLAQLAGTYYAYSYTFDRNDKAANMSSKDLFYGCYPLYFDEFGYLMIKDENNRYYRGFAKYENSKLILSITDRKIFFIIAAVPSLAKRPERIYGVLSDGNNERPEARACVLLPRSESLADLNYSSITETDDNLFRETDRLTLGILSFLRGPVNRLVRVPNSPDNEPRPRDQHASFKRSFFYAARYLFSIDKNQCRENLYLAYLHGFAQSTYRGHDIRDETHWQNEEIHQSVRKAVEDLRGEMNMLQAALISGDMRNDSEIKSYAQKLWKDYSFT